jgi:hypothetical protein
MRTAVSSAVLAVKLTVMVTVAVSNVQKINWTTFTTSGNIGPWLGPFSMNA